MEPRQPRQPQDTGLYRFANEHDACGVGLVADLNNRASHHIIEAGLTVLKRLMHRGAAGGDPETGDGAGILTAIPDAFFRRLYPSLPPQGKYGIAMLFDGMGAESEIEKQIVSEGGQIIAWREVPCDPAAIGQLARQSMPVIRQLLVSGESFASQAAFERKLYVMRRLIEKAVSDVYICSFSSRSIVYKGLLLATQIDRFYQDLSDPDFTSPLIVVHQRYSTNTFPTWNLAQPFRFLAHNGEINTLRGNLNALRAREPYLDSPLFGDDLQKLLPLITATQSDSASLDNMFELLTQTGRSMSHAMLMLLPQAWGVKYRLGRDMRGFFEYHSALMEPWDGPAAVAFSDGVNAGAILDRNGLRPARWTLMEDGLFVLSSETGVLDLDPAQVQRKGRLKPGETLFCDLENHRLLFNAEVKNRMARQQPYRRWVDENRITVSGLFSEITPAKVQGDLARLQRLFGYTSEDLEMILSPMARQGQEPVGSMGNDAALAVLSNQPQLLFNYFKQLFAQVTNPPIDPIREQLVMSLMTYIGNLGNILAETPEHAHLIKLQRPVLTDDEMKRLSTVKDGDFKMRLLPMEFDGAGGGKALAAALRQLAEDALAAARQGCRILVLSDRNLTAGMTPIPSLLATAAVNRRLSEAGARAEIGLIVQSGEVRETMHFALLIGYGATAINPYLALETVSDLALRGAVQKDPVTAASNYIQAIDKGLLKILSRMGISTLRSYRSAQLFEAVGLSEELIQEFLPGTASRIGGIGLEEIAHEALARRDSAENASQAMLPDGGQYRFRLGGENHLWTPQSLATFRQAVQQGDYELYRKYAQMIDEQAEHLCTLRGLFKFRSATPIPLEEVESEESILRHFVSAAMSVGALSPEAHEAIATALNSIGAMSNCGEGGEADERYQPGPHAENLCSAIKQVASGRFGVTINYLCHARDLQIKMAQGAKPGEGGQLPGPKVNPYIARIRHSIPGITLISPPPHHDIYSIEDLAQLIYDLHCANSQARVSVKLVSEVGIGTVAAGVAKGHADVILVSSHDGGTGAAPLSSIRHVGLPWELGLAETQQTLVLNKLRGRVRLQVDGQIKTARDVVIAALLGAEEFGFGTTMLVCLGCVMMRKCHDNSCPVGVCTQDPERRKCFRGKPEYIVNFLTFVARQVREILASLGLHSLDEACGRTDLLDTDHAISFYKAQHLDFSKVLTAIDPKGNAVRYTGEGHEAVQCFDQRELLPKLASHISDGTPIRLSCDIHNVDRTVGTMLSGAIAAAKGSPGLPEDTLHIHCTGTAGQSFGAFLAPGVTLELTGEANDYIGKGLSGGIIAIRPPDKVHFAPEENVIAGNVIGYGATSGKIFLNGLVGERFAIRNSGATLVAEGTGDHCCEYMTGGRVAILGPVGVNFAAGMTGGVAYVYDEDGQFDLNCNVDTVDLEMIDAGSPDEAELQTILKEHVAFTDSPKAKRLLDDWKNARPKFVKVSTAEYRQALQRLSEADVQAK